MLRITLNQEVSVQLTPFGRMVHWQHFCEILKWCPSAGYVPPYEDNEGWSRWTLLDLMRIFGPSISLTGSPCFDCILVDGNLINLYRDSRN